MLGLQQAGRTCTDGKQWYVCTAGPYTGCCSIDPCTDGACPDEDSTTTKKATATSTTSRSTSTTSKPTSTTVSATEVVTSVKETTSISSSETSSKATPDATSEATSEAISSTANILSTSTSTSPAMSSSTLTSAASVSQTAVSTLSGHHSNAGMIGGVVGAVIAAILLALLLYFCIKRRRVKVKISMHRSVSTQSLRAKDQTPTTKERPSSSATALVAMAKESHHSIVSPASKTEPGISSLGNDIYNDYPIRLLSTLSSLTLSTPSNSNDTSSTPTRSSTSLAPLIVPTERPQPHRTQPLTAHVPELSDTGFRRQKAELSAQPQSELINQQRNNMNTNALLEFGQHQHRSQRVGVSGYTSKYHHTPDGANSETDLIPRTTARKFVTRDGIVLGANLDRMSSIDEVDLGTPLSSIPTPTPTPTPTATATPLSPRTNMGGRHKKSRSGTPIRGMGSGLATNASTPNQHVMSFMEYDAPSEMLEMRGGRKLDVHPALAGSGLSIGSPDSESGWRRNSKGQTERDASRALDLHPRDRGLEMDVLTEGRVGSRISRTSEILPIYESGGFYENQNRCGSFRWKKVKEDG